eukprot:15349776-Ditylum_brightwellii.AAC.1
MIGTANFKAQNKSEKLSIVVRANNIETEAEAVYVLRSNARILQDLMCQVAPHVTNHDFNCIPINLLYNKLIRHGKKNYENVLKEQNKYLTNYEGFRISGLSESMLSTEIKRKILQEHLELSSIVSDITQTIFIKAKDI